MKKIYAIALLGLMVLGLAATASAADIKATGSMKVDATWQSGTDFLDKGAATANNKPFNIEQRVRTAFQFIANENLKGVLELQLGTANWGAGPLQMNSGRQASAGAGSGDVNGGSLMLRRGYVDFKWPGTKVNVLAGFQTVGLPAAFGGGSAILDDQMAAAIVTTPLTDNLKLLAGYSRMADANTSTFTDTVANGNFADVAFAALPIDFKGFNITPFGAYAYVGRALGAASGTGLLARGFTGVNQTSGNEGIRAYWGGVATTITALDGFKIMADFNYGHAGYNQSSANNRADGGRKGWLADIAVDYTGLKNMTPSAYFVYSSGEKGNSTDGGNGGSNRMPVVGTPQNWAIGSFFFADRNLISRSTLNSGSTDRVMGFWAAGVSLKDMTFIDKLSHTAHLLYAKGTNDKRYIIENNASATRALYGGFLTEKDSLWEVDFNTKYMIYDELSLMLDLGYINADFDKTVWGNSNLANAADLRQHAGGDAYRAALSMTYSF